MFVNVQVHNWKSKLIQPNIEVIAKLTLLLLLIGTREIWIER